MEFKGDIIITDPCYICKDGDWEFCDYGESMNKLGLTKYIVKGTIYGDWSCRTIDKNTGSSIGTFCADAGMVGVFLLDEVLKYNPNFDYHVNRLWTTTLIKNFNGDVDIIYDDKIDEMSVVGEGNIDFFTIQTGF